MRGDNVLRDDQRSRAFFGLLLMGLGIGGSKQVIADEILTGAMRTQNGHYLTAVGGGGLGGPNSGPGVAALHSDAAFPGEWETFRLEWTDRTKCEFLLGTSNKTYVTAVGGGGIGGPNNGLAPFHTDARQPSGWEMFKITFREGSADAFIQTANGRFVTAVGGGGVGGPNTVPIRTDTVNAFDVGTRFTLSPPDPRFCGTSVRASCSQSVRT